MTELEADLENAKARLAEAIANYGEQPEGTFAKMIVDTCRTGVRIAERDLDPNKPKSILERLKDRV